MSTENQYYDFLHAYALGCLDPKDLNILNEFLDTGEDFFWEELGEYQNLAALLPSILNIETPSIELKDKVARKLYQLRNEKRIKAVEGKAREAVKEDKIPESNPILPISGQAKSAKEEKLASLFNKTRIRIKEDESRESGYRQLSEIDTGAEASPQLGEKDFEPVITKERIPQADEEIWEGAGETGSSNEIRHNLFTGEHTEIDTGGITGEDIKTEPEPREKKTYQLHGIDLKPEPVYANSGKEKKKIQGGIVFSLILFLIVACGVIYFYAKISSEVNSYKTGIEKLDNQLKDLTSKLADNQQIQSMLQSKDVHIVNLSATSLGKDSYGKLIISLETSKGYLQLTNMPMLPGNEIYTLWIIIDKKFVMLSEVKSSSKKEFYPFMLPELNNRGKTVFLVSKESAIGASKPSKDILLTGTME